MSADKQDKQLPSSHDNTTDHDDGSERRHNDSSTLLKRHSSRHDTSSEHDLSGEAAGVVRGVSRSLGKSVLRAPIGQLPRRGILRQKLAVKQIARVSDRASQGLEFWSAATESNERHYIRRFLAFTKTFVKNTFLGTAVYETYGYTVTRLAPPPAEDRMTTMRKISDVDDDIINELDEYERASLPSHVTAGWLAGSVHGVLSSLLEQYSHSQLARYTALNTFHHSMAHAVLFGSYESIKRFSLPADENYYGIPYLAVFTVAGGLAGQIQFLCSHYIEQYLGLTNESLIPSLRRPMIHPLARSLLMSFPPSAIGFVAFEYGKKVVADI